MKKILLLAFVLIISENIIAQNDLAKSLSDVEGYWTVEDNKVCVSAVITNAENNALQMISYEYALRGEVSVNGDTLVVRGKFGNVSSDVYMDYTEKIYKPEYEITVIKDTCLYVKVFVDRLISKLNSDEDNNMTNIYPINTGSRSSGGMPISSKKEERVKVNEGFVFCKVVNKMKDEIVGIARLLNSDAVFEVQKDEQDIKPVEEIIVEDMMNINNFDNFDNINHIDLKLDKFRKTALAGDLMMIGGSSIAVSSLFVDNASTFMAVSGGLISLAGLITHICSYSYLKPTPIKVSPNGIAYTF